MGYIFFGINDLADSELLDFLLFYLAFARRWEWLDFFFSPIRIV